MVRKTAYDKLKREFGKYLNASDHEQSKEAGRIEGSIDTRYDAGSACRKAYDQSAVCFQLISGIKSELMSGSKILPEKESFRSNEVITK